MIICEAIIDDIPQIQGVRNSVTEDVLSDPKLVTDEDCKEFIIARGKGWVCEIDDKIVGFAIADIKDNNIWAFFLNPAYEKKGIGRQLHDIMLNWYFKQAKTTVWLGTTPDTRAEQFYLKAGWTETCKHGRGEIKFEMNYNDWVKKTGN